VVVASVAKGSRADQNQLDAGDLVLGINRRAVADLNDFRAQLGQKPPQLNLVLQRGAARGELPMR
jgi:S1-C subfamily serine protease